MRSTSPGADLPAAGSARCEASHSAGPFVYPQCNAKRSYAVSRFDSKSFRFS
ncbi:hypothetical protein R70006_04327 [Paraburkholderia domus]|jgi:hypothetical protein|nr:hypothetical protein R75483_02133 [Paraburkholderia domus]CAE6779486.1 hypothetical protein R70006_04327 [Paraburkholderia domus]CAE6889977.1 hypothetical protein R70199_03058 [Paraburkholderia domus]